MGETKHSGKAAGPELPKYLGKGDFERPMAIILALVSKFAALRERLDTHQGLGRVAAPALVVDYRADPATEAERKTWRDAYIRRLFRVSAKDIDTVAGAVDPEAR